MKIILDVLEKIPGILQEDKKPSVGITSLGTSTMNLTAYYWLDTFDNTHSSSDVKTKAIDEVLNALDEAGFYMPGDIVEMKNYKEKALNQKVQ